MASKQCFFSIPINFFLTTTKTDDVTLYWRILVSSTRKKDIYSYSITAQGITFIWTSTSSALVILTFHTLKQFLFFFLMNFLNQKEILVFKKICLRITYFLKIISEVLFIKS